MSDRLLTEKIRAEILNFGMDLVGFAPVSRWKHAPFLLSPQAILPGSKTVVVGAIHITDTWTEMGGEPEPQDASPGGWMDQNSLMDRTAYRTVRMLNDHGYKAIGIASSNIWRYREYEGIPSLFAPDLSHIHAATAAGLAEIGWSGLAITPEFGSRCRFISIVTNADLVPTPMYNGPALCDMCMECVRHCPTYSLKKELGKPHEVKIGGKKYKYANKNMWRCAWGEHFNLDLNSDTLGNDTINEKTIINELNTRGVRGHERGVCQKYCVPPHLRTRKPSFGRDKMIAQNRINPRYPDSMPTLRKMRDDISAFAVKFGAELVFFGKLDKNSEAGKAALKEAPGMRTVVSFAFGVPENFLDLNLPEESKSIYGYAYRTRMHHLLLRTARLIEDYGYHAASYTGTYSPCWPQIQMGEKLAAMTQLGEIKDNEFYTVEFGKNVFIGAITTDAPVDCSNPNRTEIEVARKVKLEGKKLRSKLEYQAEKSLVSMFGVASAGAFKDTAQDLKQAVDEKELGESVVDGSKLTYHGPYKPKIIRENKKLKLPGDYLQDAKSVIVLGMHFPIELIENSGLAETQQVGTYAFHQYQTCFELRIAAGQVADILYANGYKVVITENMLGIGSLTDSPRRRLPDARSNAIEAVAAGLGEIGKSGALLTEEYGPHQRRIVIITDAELPVDDAYKGKKLCMECNRCVEKCPMSAFEERTVPVRVGGITIDYPVTERHRCDWSKMYSLCSEEGPGLIGNNTNVKAPEGKKLTINDLAEACKQKDPIMKSRTCVLETCLRHCQAVGRIKRNNLDDMARGSSEKPTRIASKPKKVKMMRKSKRKNLQVLN